jgi:hypothetical protein
MQAKAAPTSQLNNRFKTAKFLARSDGPLFWPAPALIGRFHLVIPPIKISCHQQSPFFLSAFFGFTHFVDR